MSVSTAVEGKSNYVQSRSSRLVVYDPALLAFLLENRTFRPIIEATRSVKGQQLFIPYIFDIISNRKLSLVKVYPKSAVWKTEEDYSGKPIYEFVPSNDFERTFQASWVEINRAFSAEMLRMQSTVLNGREATEYVMVEKDKITQMSEAVKAKSASPYVEGRDLHTASLNMVYFMERDGTSPAVGIKFQESFPIDPTYKVATKRRLEKTDEKEEA